MKYMTYIEAMSAIENLFNGKDSVIKMQWDGNPIKESASSFTRSDEDTIRNEIELGGHIRYFTENNYQIVVFSDVGNFDYISEIRKGGRTCHKKDLEKLDEKYCDVKHIAGIRKAFYIPGYLRSLTEAEIVKIQSLLRT